MALPEPPDKRTDWSIALISRESSCIEVLADTVTICPSALNELASKIALSEDVGAEAPEEPPEEVLQFDVLALFQVPEPPTQYLSAILCKPLSPTYVV